MRLAAFTIVCMLSAAAAADQVRVTVRMIEVPHRELTKWMEDPAVKGQALHDKALKLALAGEAEIAETNVLTVRSGGKALLESIAEMIYPSDYDPPGHLYSVAPGTSLPPFVPTELYTRAADVVMASFETRNTGATLRIEPTITENGKVADLRLNFDMVDRASLVTWTEFRDEWGDASVRMPVFGSKKMEGSLTLFDGVFELWNTFTPQPAAIPAATTRMLVFVRADVLPIPSE